MLMPKTRKYRFAKIYVFVCPTTRPVPLKMLCLYLLGENCLNPTF